MIWNKIKIVFFFPFLFVCVSEQNSIISKGFILWLSRVSPTIHPHAYFPKAPTEETQHSLSLSFIYFFFLFWKYDGKIIRNSWKKRLEKGWVLLTFYPDHSCRGLWNGKRPLMKLSLSVVSSKHPIPHCYNILLFRCTLYYFSITICYLFIISSLTKQKLKKEKKKRTHEHYGVCGSLFFKC